MMRKYHVRFGGGRLEKGPQGYLVSRLPNYRAVTLGVLELPARILTEAEGTAILIEKVGPDKPLFETGRLVATPAAMVALAASGIDPLLLIARHRQGDWGNVDAEDKGRNDWAITVGERLLSAYTLPETSGVREVWIITEADRNATTLLLPSEY